MSEEENNRTTTVSKGGMTKRRRAPKMAERVAILVVVSEGLFKGGFSLSAVNTMLQLFAKLIGFLAPLYEFIFGE